jgi:hypothetical protein
MTMHDNTLRTLAGLGMEAARSREPVPVQARRQEPRPPVLMVAEIECHDGSSIWHRDTVSSVEAPSGIEHVLERFAPADYSPTQPVMIPITRHHDRDRVIGHVEYLSWATGPDRIFAVCSIAADAAEEWAQGDAYVSPGTRRNPHSGRLTLDHLGLCRSTARIAAAPVKWTSTDFSARSRWTPQTTPRYDLLTRAYDARRERAKGAGIPIVGHPGFDEQLGEQRASRDPGPLAPEYWRRNGEGGLHFSGGIGRVVDVR